MTIREDLDAMLGAFSRPGVSEQVRADKGSMSNRAYARAHGVGEATVRRWLSGESKPNAANAGWIASAFAALPVAVQRAAGVDPAVEKRIRDNGVVFNVVYDSGGRTGRTATLSNTNLRFKPGTGDKVMDKWIAGDSEGAARALRDGIGDQVYRHRFFRDDRIIDGEADEDASYEGQDIDDGDSPPNLSVVGMH